MPHDATISAQPPLELWGGHECTVNRVGDSWFDQTIRSGHEYRLEDLALFANLGIRSLRYPALWERIAPHDPEQRDFRWTDERLPEIRRLGMQPILTLCHHGSGPHYTSLIDDSFAPGLARHAAAVAEHYPWVRDYTPVNEPLTTARFSALYGYWYPHTRDEGLFWTALLNEIDATRLAMRAIRKVNPKARLIQTDDLGYCHAMPPLQHEADFQNHRRWMGWDLLCGMVVPGHALWERLTAFGLEPRLRAIADDPCPPDVIGVNHYLSSERLLDHRLELHVDRGLADREIGKRGGVPHVDVDAQRSIPDQLIGFAGLITQAWERYRLPVAITESHHGSTRDEQARWFIETWDIAQALRANGVDVPAVTAWSLLGSYDWNHMVTRVGGFYEPGIFDVRDGRPRSTVMASVLKNLAKGRRPAGPGLAVEGWWRSSRRALLAVEGSKFALKHGPHAIEAPEPLLILGDGGMLTDLVAAACEARGLHYLLAIDDAERVIATARPWAVLDARDGDVDEALPTICAERGIVGAVFRPYSPGVERADPDGLLVVETGPIFSASDEGSALVTMLDALDAGDEVDIDAEAAWSGVYGPVLIDGVLDLLLDGVTGVTHFVAEESWSAADVARLLAKLADREPTAIDELRTLPAAAERAIVSYLPPLEICLERFASDRRRIRSARAEWLIQAAE